MKEIRNKKNIFPVKGFTHSGVFHADDVFTTAFLKILNPDFTWERGTVVPENYDGIVYDIGCGAFDHHQQDARVRENGVPYAAFGLVWEKYGQYVMDVEDADAFDKEFVQMIDLTDNTGKRNPVSSIIHDMNPEWDEEVLADVAFAKAVDYAITTLRAEFKHINSKRHANQLVREKMEDAVDGILLLEKYMPWRNALKKSNIEYVIYESNRGGYNIQTVPHGDNNETYVSFPVSWRGKTREELEVITGIEGLSFCHKGGFLCAADTLKAAREVATVSLAYRSQMITSTMGVSGDFYS